MKNKLYIIIGSIVIVVAIIAASLFLILTKDMEPAAQDFELKGNWILVAHGQALNDNQYLTFDGTTVVGYKNGAAEPNVNSNFEFKDGNLNLPDLKKSYKASKVSDNCLTLVDDKANLYSLVRCESDGKTAVTFDTTKLVGEWKVVLHGGSPVENHKMIFDGVSLKNYRNSDTPAVDSPYTIEGDKVVVAGVGLELKLCYLSDELVVLVEANTGNVFELAKE